MTTASLRYLDALMPPPPCKFTVDKRYCENLRKGAKQRGAIAPSNRNWQSIKARYDYYGGRCYLCGSPAEAMDHVVAISRGGPHIPANLRPACAFCNGSKNNRPLVRA